jgi:hypothetical protein
MTTDTFRLYENVGKDGYPPEWHDTIKHEVRKAADHRCVRCLHPYRNGENGNGEWSPCDDQCRHRGPIRVQTYGEWYEPPEESMAAFDAPGGLLHALSEWPVEARWRILTVHHLDGNKANCRWWNLASLCQRCHLQIQGKVLMGRVYPWEHSDWFKPYVAGYYASVYLGEELTRAQTLARLDELLALERAA